MVYGRCSGPSSVIEKCKCHESHRSCSQEGYSSVVNRYLDFARVLYADVAYAYYRLARYELCVVSGLIGVILVLDDSASELFELCTCMFPKIDEYHLSQSQLLMKLQVRAPTRSRQDSLTLTQDPMVGGAW
jgi:hypothetical protein